MKTPDQELGTLIGGDTLYIQPAYGRTMKTALQDWKDGKDFYSHYGYLSIRDIDTLSALGYNDISIRQKNVPISLRIEI